MNLTPQEVKGASLAYVFRHALLQETVYHSLLFAQRRQLHRFVAEWYEQTQGPDLEPFAAVLAYHWGRAACDRKAIEYLEIAGDQSLRGGAHDEAVGFFTEAIRILEETKGKRQEKRTETEDGKDEGQGDDPLPLVGELEERLPYWEGQLGEAYLGLGNLVASREHIEKSLALYGYRPPSGWPSLLAGLVRQGLVQLKNRLFRWGRRPPTDAARQDFRRAARYAERLAQLAYYAHESLGTAHAGILALNLAEKVGPSPELARGYATACVVFGLAPLHGLARHYRALAEEAVRHVEDPSAQCWVYELVGVYSLGLAEWPSALKYLELAAEVSRRFGDMRRWEEVTTLLATAIYYQGDLQRCERLFGEVLEHGRARGDDQAHVFGLVGLAMCGLHGGEEALALDHLERAASLVTTHMGLGQLIWVHGVSAAANWLFGHHAEAETHACRAAEAIRRSRPTTVYTLEGYAGAAFAFLNLWRAARGTAREGELRREAKQSCRDFWQFARFFPIGRPRAWRYQGMAAIDGRARQARRCWQESLKGA
jgi:tetratricopeptide (TPR) repeat protein